MFPRSAPVSCAVIAIRVIGAGRAGTALVTALGRAGWDVPAPWGRDRDLTSAAAGVELLVLATPDRAIAEVAAAVRPERTTTVAHLAGSLGLAPLSPHHHRAALHPLATLPDAERGAAALHRSWWAVSAEDHVSRRAVMDVVGALEGRSFSIPEDHRALYHAAACVASNHLVALWAQVEALAAEAGVPMDALVELAGTSLDNAGRLGAARALTGPVARGDWATVDLHRRALPPAELALYEALAAAAARLAGRHLPPFDPPTGG
jgi:predicted short-subunit dehydrogenase-like oxidoreductase (DUF2520 family)